MGNMDKIPHLQILPKTPGKIITHPTSSSFNVANAFSVANGHVFAQKFRQLNGFRKFAQPTSNTHLEETHMWNRSYQKSPLVVFLGTFLNHGAPNHKLP
jgi:hypothetical protein